jgi:Cu-processing system permease protein
MKKTFIIAFNTSREIFRDRVLYALVVLAVLLVLASLVLGELSFAEQSKIITDMGVMASELGCCMLAIFVGSSLVWREIEKQTVLTLLSKPVSRTQFLMGKFLGLAFVLLVVDILISLFLVGICIFFGKLNFTPFIFTQIGILEESFILLAMTLFFGVFCRPILTTVFTLCVWVLGHTVDDLYFFSSKSKDPIFNHLGRFIAKILPNFNSLTFKEAVTYGDVIPTSQVVNGLLLFILWSSVLLLAASLIFRRRDFT